MDYCWRDVVKRMVRVEATNQTEDEPMANVGTYQKGGQVKFSSTLELATLLREAQNRHHEYERTLGGVDSDWATWYANCLAHLVSQVEKPHAGFSWGIVGDDLGSINNQLSELPADSHPGSTFIQNYVQGTR